MMPSSSPPFAATGGIRAGGPALYGTRSPIPQTGGIKVGGSASFHSP
jgi:hypothetical protein